MKDTLAGLAEELGLGMLGQESDSLMGGQRTKGKPPSSLVEKREDSDVMSKEGEDAPASDSLYHHFRLVG